ncbi:MAG TPA: CBS domain-containing protein [Candidatus Limnocylindria bacterium]|nr:CBS domain-containing protein [Candidatus Limnocylindria bacterium]
MKVRDVMSRDVISVPRDMHLKELAGLLTDHQISGAPVTDADGAVIGVVSEADILMKQVGRTAARRRPLEWIFGESHDAEEIRRRVASTVGEAMTSPAVTIDAERPLREGAALMVDSKVNRLPVLEDGNLVGILTRADLVHAYLRRDEEALRAVREDVFRKTMWLEPERYETDISEGALTLAGKVDRKSTAEIIGRLAGLVEGVDRVDNRLTWDLDDSDIQPPSTREPMPGAVDLTARERPRPLGR